MQTFVQLRAVHELVTVQPICCVEGKDCRRHSRHWNERRSVAVLTARELRIGQAKQTTLSKLDHINLIGELLLARGCVNCCLLVARAS